MKVDIGFWDINGNYIPDIQEVSEVEMKEYDIKDTKHIDESNQEYIAKQNMDKNFNEFFDELNNMANFKNFGESKEEEITNADGSRNWEANILLDNVKRLEQENETLRITREKLLGDLCITEETLKDYEEHYNRSEQENTELKAEDARLKSCLQEIKEFCKKEIEYFDNNDDYGQQADFIALLQIITKAEEE